MIELKHITKVFPTADGELTALNDVNITIHDGDVYGIVGMSGAGKSTLVRCINLLERPTSGQVVIDGKDLCVMPAKELHPAAPFHQHDLSAVQPAHAADLSEKYLLSHGDRRRDQAADAQKQAKELLEIVGLPDKADAYPAQLSGGQKQRIAIARALASDPKILLCDEATSALDPKTTQDILKLVKDINQRLGITVVVITHEMAVVEEICTHVAILDHGVLQESGTVEDIFSNPQTEAGRRLVYPNGVVIDQLPAANVIRIAFNGGSSYEPLIASLAIDCGVKVNILGADTRNIDGKAFGTMLLGLPTDPERSGQGYGIHQEPAQRDYGGGS